MGIISGLTDLIEGNAVKGSTPGWVAKKEHRSSLQSFFCRFTSTTSNREGQADNRISPIHPALICGGQPNLMLVNQGYRWSLLGLGVSEPKSIAPVKAVGDLSESDVEGRLQGLSNGRRVHACTNRGWTTPLLTVQYTQAPIPFREGECCCDIAAFRACSSFNVWCTLMNRWQCNAVWG